MLTPYPTTFAPEIIDGVVGLVRGTATTAHAVHCATELVLFGLGQVLPDDGTVPPDGRPPLMAARCCADAKTLSDDELCAELDKLKACCAGDAALKAAGPNVGSFDWKSLVKTLLPIIISFLA